MYLIYIFSEFFGFHKSHFDCQRLKLAVPNACWPEMSARLVCPGYVRH